MLDALGLSTLDEAVYRTMLEKPELDVAGISAHLGIDAGEVRSALDSLVDLALVRLTGDGRLRATRPNAGLLTLLAKAEAAIVTRQRQIEATRTAVAAIASAYDEGEPEPVRRLATVEAVRERLTELTPGVRFEVLSFSSRTAEPEGIEAARRLNTVLLQRGVSMRNLYPESFRNNPTSLAFARWMREHGSRSRTVPTLPIRQLVIMDREIALVPIDPAKAVSGALEVSSPGVVLGLVALFEQVWETGTPFGETPPRDAEGLMPQERELLRLMANGHTDESAGRQLGISTRSVQRMMTALTERLGATSRFQTGVEAARHGWV